MRSSNGLLLFTLSANLVSKIRSSSARSCFANFTTLNLISGKANENHMPAVLLFEALKYKSKIEGKKEIWLLV